jgi:hypothetical protein
MASAVSVIGTASATIGTSSDTVVDAFWFVQIDEAASTYPRKSDPESPMKMEAGLKL